LLSVGGLRAMLASPEIAAPRAASSVSADVVADRAVSPRRRIVTVAADDGEAITYLAVPIARDGAGRLFVSGAPAVVGPPAMAPHALGEPEVEIDDPRLRATASRVVRNYLGRDRADLAADLGLGAVVSLPARRLRVESIDAVTWVVRGSRVAVALSAHDRDRLQLSLRYELDVVRRAGRWLVQTVEVNPLYREVSP